MSRDATLIPIRGRAELGPVALAVECGDRRVLLDGGTGGRGSDEWVDGLGEIDGVWVSHAHFDHCGALGELWKGRPRLDAAATPATARLVERALTEHPDCDSTRAADVRAGFRTVRTRESFEFPSIRSPRESGFRARVHPAGHLLGAAMLALEVGGERLVYTGDFCLHDQFLVGGADLEPLASTDVGTLVMEGVLATDETADDIEYARELDRLVEWCTEGAGPVLVAAQASGEAVEFAAALEAGGAEVAVDDSLEPVLETYSASLEQSLPEGRPESEVAAHLRGGGAAVAPGDQFDGGTASNRLAGRILGSEEARLAVANRAYASTPAGKLMEAESGDRLRAFEGNPTKSAAARRFTLPAHAPRHQLVEAVGRLDPERAVLVHGRESRLQALRRALRDAGFEGPVEIPRNGERVELG